MGTGNSLVKAKREGGWGGSRWAKRMGESRTPGIMSTLNFLNKKQQQRHK